MTNLRLLTLGIVIQKSAIVKRFYEKAAIDLVIKVHLPYSGFSQTDLGFFSNNALLNFTTSAWAG